MELIYDNSLSDQARTCDLCSKVFPYALRADGLIDDSDSSGTTFTRAYRVCGDCGGDAA